METDPLVALLTLFLPIVAVFAVVYVSTHTAHRQTSLLRDLVFSCVVISIAISWILAFYNMPPKLLNVYTPTLTFGIHIMLGALLIVAGALMPNRLQKYFLMGLGLFSVVIEIPFVFTNFGSYGALAVVGLALAALVGATLWLHLKGKHE